jgi:predicted amidohydrolase YtcJ
LERENSLFEKKVIKVSSLWDHHGHLSMLGAKGEKINLEKISSPDELYEIIKKEAQRRKKGEWIIGFGVNPSLWGERNCEITILDKVSPENPIFLERVDAHSAFVNTFSVKISQLSLKKNCEGGFFEKKKGVFTGGITDSLVEKVVKSFEEPSEECLKRRFKRAFAELRKNFLSGASDMMLTRKEAEILQTMDKEKTLELSVLGYLKWSKNDNIPNALYKGKKYEEEGIKVFLDGALGSRGACLKEPYSDDAGNYGIINYNEKEICEILEECSRKNVNVSFHIIGDGALETFLNSFERTKNLKIKVRLEHLQITPEELIQRLKKIDVVISLQPSHYLSDRKWAEKRIGSERMGFSYLLKSIVFRKKTYLFGTDFPIEPPNPRRTIKGCLERKKEERISLSKILCGMKAPKQFLKFAKPCEISFKSNSKNSERCFSEIGIKYVG